jgi:RNA polymerase sigma-70 factor (ECF subfamily)
MVRSMTSDDDGELMLRYQRTREESAFLLLFRRNKDALFRFLLRLSSNEAIAEDISQFAWMRILEIAREQRYGLQESASFRTYLFTLARNRYVDEYCRKHQASRTQLTDPSDFEALVGEAPGADPAILAEAASDRHRVNEALAQLSQPQREVLALWTQGFELKDVAQMTGESWNTIVSRKKYALRRLAARLAPDAPVGVL